MKKFLVGVIGLLAIIQANAEVKWLTSVPEALQKAKAENKLVLLDFTGSDWCGWCIKLDKEVFSTSDFEEYVKKNVVPVKVDFPRRIEQSEELKKANQALQKKYGIEGYPTIVVLNSQGKEVGRLGYQPGGPKPFIEQLAKLKGK